ncbi:MAG TPA: hypothetical protein VIL44_06165 [Micromonospora sp.]
MDSELLAARAAHRAGPVITGHVVRLQPGYPRELKIRQPLLVAILFAASIGRFLGALRTAGTGDTRRRWRDLRKGPEFLVTPLHVRDRRGVLCEVEIHGHLPQSALDPGDYVQVTVRPQKDPALPPRVERIVNITTHQVLTPRIPTIWTHLGPPMVVQAIVGLLVLGLLVTLIVIF